MEKWSKEGIKDVLDENVRNLIRSSIAAAFLLFLAVATPYIGKHYGIDAGSIKTAGIILLVEMAIGYPIFVLKILRILRRRKKLTNLYDELERTGKDEIEIDAGTYEKV